MLIQECAIILILLFSTIYSGKASRRKGMLQQPQDFESWTGKWFPFDENARKIINTHNNIPKQTLNEVDDWQGKWFPFEPNSPILQFHEPVCDDAEYSIGIDFDPNDKRQSFNYLCLVTNRTIFKPNLSLEAIEEAHVIPPAYVPPVKCLDASITYDEPLPTFGAFRALPPKYGTYRYLPPQRWLRSVAEGAIVMLYHPCAFPGQVNQLQNALRSCLYRHVITPTVALSPERPLALIAWGRKLQMSVVDPKTVANFIQSNAKKGPVDYLENRSEYAKELIKEAKLVTDIHDTEICGYKDIM